MAAQYSKLAIGFEDGISAGVNAATAAMERTAKAMERLGVASEKEEAIVRRVGKSHDVVARQIDGTAAALAKQETALRRYEASLEAVNKAEQKNRITAEEAAKQRERLGVIRDQEVAKAVEHGRALDARFSATEKASDGLAKASNATSMAMRNLGIQSIDVFQQLASGAPVMMTLVQQGGQVAQMAAVTGTSLGALAKSAAGVVAGYLPMIAATAGVVGFGVAIYSVFQRSSELDAQQRSLSVSIRGVGREAELSAAGLQSYVTQLKQQGVAAAEAMTSVAALARNSSLSSGTIGRIVGLGPDAAAALGVSVPDAMKQLAEAATGSADAVRKLDDAFNLLNPTEAAQVETMIKHGDKAKALGVVFDALQARVQGLNRDALSPMDQAFRDLGNSWDQFMNRIARSEPVMRMMQGAAYWLRDANVHDLTMQMATLQGEAAEQRRTIDRYGSGTSVARQEYTDRARARLVEIETQIRGIEARITGMQPASVQGGPVEISANAAAKEIDRMAQSRFAGSDAGRLAALASEAAKYREELAKLVPGTEDFTARSGNLNAALSATQKEIEELQKKGEPHRTGLEKLGDTYAAQIKAANDLTAAYGQSRSEEARVLAVREAETKAISEGLTPGTAKHTAVVEDLTEQILKLRNAEGKSEAAKTLRDVTEATESQRRMAAAYDGTEASLIKAQAAEQAHAAALRAKLIPGTTEYAEAVERLTAAYAEGSEVQRDFQQMQSSVNALFNVFTNTVDRLAQGLVDATLNGARGFANLATIGRAALASIAAEMVKLALVNPTLNVLFGGRRDTLGAAAGALAGGAGGAAGGGILGGGLLSGLGSALSLGRVSDLLGLTSFGEQLSGLGSAIGLTGEGGLFGGIGSGVSSILGTTVFEGSAGSLALLGGAEFGGASLAAAGVPVTLGQLIGGAGLGFGAGSLAGSLLQSALGKTGPAPMVGSGLGGIGGALLGSILPGVGTVLGGLIGGLLGGGIGGFIGPKPKTPFSATGLTLDDAGMLGAGRTFAQIVDTSGEVAALQQQVHQINSLLSSAGARVTNTTSVDEYGQRRINDANTNTWINVGQGDGRSPELSFGALRFGATDPFINAGLSGRSFGNIEELAGALSEFTTFLNDTAPALKQIASGDPSYGIGTLATSVQALRDQFDSAKATADKLGWAEYDLIAAREKAVQAANDNANAALTESNRSLNARRAMAEGVWTGDIQKQLDAVLSDFDAETKTQQEARKSSLLSVFGDAFAATQAFADQMLVLEQTRGAERLATAKSYLEQINAAQTQQSRAMEQASGSAANIIQGITGYVRNLTFANDSPLSAGQRYSSASAQFRQALSGAMGGDAAALASLTNAAETFRLQSRAMFGSGAQYAADVQSLIAGLQNIGLTSPESLTNTVYMAGVKTQTETLVASLETLRAEVASLKSALILATTNGPPSARAA